MKEQRDKRDILILSSLIFIVMLTYNFSIKKMNFGDDAFFLKQFTQDFKSNYYEFLKFRYTEWTSRLVIETVLTQAVQHVFLWRIINAAAMTVVAVLPSLLFESDNRRRGMVIGTGISLLVPAASMNNAGWMATTTNYVWVMAAGLLSIWPIMNYVRGKKIPVVSYCVSLIFLIYATNQEQMVVIMLASVIVLAAVIYTYKKNLFVILPHIVITIASFIFILTCKGNVARNIQETKQWLPEFVNYSTFDKLQLGYTSTLKALFFEWSPLMMAFVLLVFVASMMKNQTTSKKIISSLPMIVYLISVKFNAAIDEKFDMQTGETYWPLILLLTVLLGVYIFGIWGSSSTFKEFLLVIFILTLGVGSRIMMGFSPTIWVSGARTYYFTYILIMIAGVELISLPSKGENSRKLVWLIVYITLLVALLGLMYAKYI